MKFKNSPPTDWQSRAHFYGLHTVLCTSKEQFDGEFKRMTRTKDDPSNDPLFWCKPGMAACHTLDPKGGGTPACIVTIDMLSDNCLLDPINAISKLVHEATHVKQHTMEVIGERNPSPEFEAYVMQNISHNLIEDYQRQLTWYCAHPSYRAQLKSLTKRK